MEVEGFSPDQVEQVLGNLFAGSNAFLAEICSWLMVADRNQQWLSDGAADPGQWLSARFGLAHATGARLWRVARRLEGLPRLAERFAAGELSLDQVDAISRMATPATEEDLIEEAMGLSNTELERRARRANPPSTEDERTIWQRRHLYVQHSLDRAEGTMAARLHGPELEMVEAVLRDHADRMPVNPETGDYDPYPARLADSLVEVCVTTSSGSGSRSTTTRITVHADLDALLETEAETTTGVAEIESGPVIASETARRLACDTILESVVYADECVIGVGRSTRTIPGWLRRLLCHRGPELPVPGL